MESLEFDHARRLPQETHYELQMLWIRDVSGHDLIVRPLKQKLAEQLDGLPLSNIVRRHDQLGMIRLEEIIKVGIEELGH